MIGWNYIRPTSRHDRRAGESLDPHASSRPTGSGGGGVHSGHCADPALRGKQNIYEHTVNVPLILSGPGTPPDNVFDAQVYLRDLYPTICELIGVSVPVTVAASSFARVLKGEVESVHEYVFGYFADSQRMIRGDRWKLIRYPQADREQLFDLREDPFELKDLSADAQHAEQLSRLRAELAAWQQRVGDPLAAP